MSNERREPVSVRWIWRIRDLLQRNRRRAALIAVGAAGLAWLLSGVFIVESGETGVRVRLGRLLSEHAGPGVNLKMPAPLERVTPLDTSEIHRLSIEGEVDRTIELLTGDQNLIQALVTLQYRIDDPGRFLFSTENIESIIDSIVRSELVDAFAKLPVDDVLTSAKALIQQETRSRSQTELDRIAAGVVLVTVNLQQVAPPREAVDAFRAVVDARSQSASRISQTRTRQERETSLARGEANRTLQTAEASADSLRSGAEGAAERFGDLLSRYRVNPDQTRNELLFQARAAALPKARVIVLPSGESADIDVFLADETGNR